MEAAEIQNVCRLCPANQFQNEDSLINVLDNNVHKNMMEVILVTTGIQISKNDMISTKICQRCCKITLQMYKFRQDALKKDRALKEKFQQMLTNRSLRVESSSVPIENDQCDSRLNEEVCKLVPSTGSHVKHKLHPSITELYQTYPNIKLPKTCVDKHMAPVVAIPLHAVQIYLDNRQLASNHKNKRNVAKKRTGSSTKRNKIMAKVSKDSYECSTMTADLTGVVKNKLQDDMNQCSVADNSVSNDPFKKHFQDSSSSSVSNRSAENNVAACQPTFLKSFGLTPTTQLRQMYVCNICKNVYDSAKELKHHKYKHVMCQFCKQKFEFVEEKELHITSLCEVSKLFSSPFPIVYLEKIHFNVDIRKSYKDAFFGFDPIFENKVEPTAIPLTSSSFPDDPNNIIVLSDDDDVQCQTANIINTDVPRESAVVPAGSEADVVYKTVSIVKPNITINKSPLLNSIRASNISDKAFLTEVITLLKPPKNTSDALLQTDLPTCKDIHIIKLTYSCEFKNLTSELFTYKIPVNLEHGFFHVAFEFNSNHPANNTKAHWKTLKVVDTKSNPPAATIKDRASSSVGLKYVSPLAYKSAPGSKFTEPRLDATPVSSTLTVIPTSLRGGSTSSNTSSTFVSPTSNVAVSSESSGPVCTENAQSSLFQSCMQRFELPPPAPPINKSIPVPTALGNSALTKKVSTYTPKFVDPRYKIRPSFYNNVPNVYYKRNPKKAAPIPSPRKNIQPSSSVSTHVTNNAMTMPLNGYFPQNRTAGSSAQTLSSLLSSSLGHVNNQVGTPTNAFMIFPTQQTAPSPSVLQISPVVNNQPGAPICAIPNTASTDRPKFRVKSVFELQ